MDWPGTSRPARRTEPPITAAAGVTRTRSAPLGPTSGPARPSSPAHPGGGQRARQRHPGHRRGDAPATDLARRVRAATAGPPGEPGATAARNPARPAPSADLGILAEPALTDAVRAERERSPEETRATMSAIQRGWERGRSVFDPAGGNGGTAEPRPRASRRTDATDPVDAEHGSGPTADTGITPTPQPARRRGGADARRPHRRLTRGNDVGDAERLASQAPVRPMPTWAGSSTTWSPGSPRSTRP